MLGKFSTKKIYLPYVDMINFLTYFYSLTLFYSLWPAFSLWFTFFCILNRHMIILYIQSFRYDVDFTQSRITTDSSKLTI